MGNIGALGKVVGTISKNLALHDAEVIEGDVGELGAAVDIAYGIDARYGSLEVVADFDEAFIVDFDAGVVEAKAVGVGLAAGGHQEGVDGIGLVAILNHYLTFLVVGQFGRAEIVDEFYAILFQILVGKARKSSNKKHHKHCAAYRPTFLE